MLRTDVQAPPLAPPSLRLSAGSWPGSANSDSTFRQIGTAVGIVTYGSIFAAAQRHGAAAAWDPHRTYEHSLNQLFVVSSCLAVVGGLTSAALIRSKDFVTDQ